MQCKQIAITLLVMQAVSKANAVNFYLLFTYCQVIYLPFGLVLK